MLSIGTLAAGASACGDDDADEPDPTTTTGIVPGEVEDPGEGTTPGDGGTPATEPGGVDY